MDIDYPITPYSSAEQQRIMRDLEQHLKDAQEQGDVARTYYTQEAITKVTYE